MKPISLSIVGLGLAVEPHAQSLLELADRCHVRHAVSRSEQRTRAFAERYPFAVSTDVETAIRDPAVDAVLILTPPSTHFELCEQAFAYGKHVLVEKPLDVSFERAESIVSGAEAAGVRLGVVLQHRFRESSLRVAQVLGEGSLGQIEAASMSLPWWRAQSYYEEPGRGTLARDGGGVLMTQAIHTLDLFRSLVDPVEVVAAQAKTTRLHEMETEDYVGALLRTANDAPATMTATSAFYPGQPERIEIIGDRGTAQIAGSALRIDYLDGNSEEIASDTGTGNSADPMDFPNDAHRRLIENFLDALEGAGELRVSGEEALRSQSLIDALLSASKQRTHAGA